MQEFMILQNNQEWQQRKQKAEQERKQFEERQKKFKASKIIDSSNIPTRYKKFSPTDFIINESNQQAKKAFDNPADSFYIFGECGTGKTLLASLIIISQANNNIHGYFCTTLNLLYFLNPYKNLDAMERDLKHNIYNCQLLVIDDLGVEKNSEFNTSIIFDLINHRYNEQKQTVITSNFNIRDLQKRFGGYEGSRIGRRITEFCKPILLNPIT